MCYITPEMIIYEYGEHDMNEIVRTSNFEFEEDEGIWGPTF